MIGKCGEHMVGVRDQILDITTRFCELPFDEDDAGEVAQAAAVFEVALSVLANIITSYGADQEWIAAHRKELFKLLIDRKLRVEVFHTEEILFAIVNFLELGSRSRCARHINIQLNNSLGLEFLRYITNTLEKRKSDLARRARDLLKRLPMT
jgi:hypothetical protein